MDEKNYIHCGTCTHWTEIKVESPIGYCEQLKTFGHDNNRIITNCHDFCDEYKRIEEEILIKENGQNL